LYEKIVKIDLQYYSTQSARTCEESEGFQSSARCGLFVFREAIMKIREEQILILNKTWAPQRDEVKRWEPSLPPQSKICRDGGNYEDRGKKKT
jgi:hypothetical protein